MAVFWGIHNDRPDLDLVENGFVSIGWPGVGDIQALGDDKDVLKTRVAEVFPDAKPGAIPVWAGGTNKRYSRPTLVSVATRVRPNVTYAEAAEAARSFGR